MNFDRKVKTFPLWAFLLCTLPSGCGTTAISSIQKEFDDAGFVEIPHGIQISPFTTPPVHRGIPMIAKHPRIWAIKRFGANVEVVPSRREDGYVLIVQRFPSEDFFNKPEILAVLTGETGFNRLFLSEEGDIVEESGPWTCAIFLTQSKAGIIAWRLHPRLCGVALHRCGQDGIQRTEFQMWDAQTQFSPCYRRFRLNGRGRSGHEVLFREIWPNPH